jgi:squalene synthase HpnC
VIQDLEIKYKSSQEFASSHYENFPVVSLALPTSLRKHIAVIYQFARQADDLADEGDVSPEERIENLDKYTNKFTECLTCDIENDFWPALKNTISEKRLSTEYFYALLSAFKQDVVKKRYKNYEQLLDYCSRSANPVGRLMLQLFDVRNEHAFYFSDLICTALQLTNFYQDVSVDYMKQRIYLPQDEMQKFGVSENLFEKKQNNANFKQLMRFQVERTSVLFEEGKNLLGYLPKSFLTQMKMTVLGGEKILQKIEEMDFDVMNHRPKLSKSDYFGIFAKGVFTNAR